MNAAESQILKAVGSPPSWLNPDNQKPCRITIGELSGLLQKNLGDRLAYNDLANTVSVDRVDMPTQSIELFYVALAEVGWTISKNSAIDALMRVAYLNRYNPIEEYFNTVAAVDSIEPVDLDRVAQDYLLTSDPLYDGMLAAMLIAIVKRTYEPGCKFDECLTLHGGQGTLKSTFLKVLASPDYFIDTAQPNRKETYQAIHSCLVMELAELDYITSQKSTGELKALLSSSVDNYQLPFGRAITKFPRRSIIVATSNKRSLLRDEEHRRFWIIELDHLDYATGRVIPIQKVVDDRDRIFKAAVLAYRRGRQPMLTREQQPESNRRNAGFEVEHPLTEPLRRLCELNPRGGFDTTEALMWSGMRDSKKEVSSKDLQDAGVVLGRLGFYRTNNGCRPFGNRRIWFRKGVTAKNFDTAATGDDDDPVAPHSPAAAADAGDLPHATIPFSKRGSIGKGQGQPALLGKGENPVALWHSPVGSGFDVGADEGDDPHWPPKPQL